MANNKSTMKREGSALIYTRELNAPRELVWEVWTQPEHLKEWWGPNGFTITNKEMEVKPGSHWIFTMHGMGMDFPNNIEYLEVERPSKLVYRNGDPEDRLSFMTYINFDEAGDKTMLTMRTVLQSEEILDELNRKVNAAESGNQTLDKLELYISTQFKIRNQLKNTNMARVNTYLNFPGNTEEAFNFYKTVFGAEFGGGGIQHFGDIPQPEGMPAMAEAEQKMVLHVELPILGGHILMGTDAPESMGFKITNGNNMHISLEPDSREETDRLFNALAEGGTITMPLQDMFWGAYYGSCTDKYGVQWMVNFTAK